LSFSSRKLFSDWDFAENRSFPMKTPIASATIKSSKNGSMVDIKEWFLKKVKVRNNINLRLYVKII
jgi:hypothetical protein